ncbi:MAG: hypothetical protein R3Y47_02610 [Lachnospiraceae bacterium]
MRQTRKSSLFLLELIIAILFFSLSAAVCVQLFSYSYLKTVESEYRSLAVIYTQTALELFRNADGDMTELIAYMDAEEIAQGQYICYLDADSEEEFLMMLEVSGTEDMPRLQVSVTPPNWEEPIYSVATQIYIEGHGYEL